MPTYCEYCRVCINFVLPLFVSEKGVCQNCANKMQVVAVREEENDFQLKMAELKRDAAQHAMEMRRAEIEAARMTQVEQEKTKQQRIQAVMELGKCCDFNDPQTRSDIIKMLGN